eukprot:14445224-Heterocapsa_arctica.AAC.1
MEWVKEALWGGGRERGGRKKSPAPQAPPGPGEGGVGCGSVCDPLEPMCGYGDMSSQLRTQDYVSLPTAVQPRTIHDKL